MKTREFPAKILYIVDRMTFDAKVDLGFGLNDIKRFRVKGLDFVSYEFFKDVKELLSNKIHGKKVIIKVYEKTSLYGIRYAEVIGNEERYKNINLTEKFREEVIDLIKGKNNSVNSKSE